MLFLEISHKIHKENTCVLESLFKNLLKKRLWRSCFPVNFAKLISQNSSWNLGDCQQKCCFFLSIFLSSQQYCIASQLSYTYCVCFTTQLFFFMTSAAILPFFYFLFLKLNLFPALHLCSVLPFLLGFFCRMSVLRLRC